MLYWLITHYWCFIGACRLLIQGSPRRNPSFLTTFKMQAANSSKCKLQITNQHSTISKKSDSFINDNMNTSNHTNMQPLRYCKQESIQNFGWKRPLGIPRRICENNITMDLESDRLKTGGRWSWLRTMSMVGWVSVVLNFCISLAMS